MKYVKYLFSVFVVLGAFLIFIPKQDLKAQTNQYELTIGNIRTNDYGNQASLIIYDNVYNYGLTNDIGSWWEYFVSGPAAPNPIEFNFRESYYVYIYKGDYLIQRSKNKVNGIFVGYSGFINGVQFYEDGVFESMAFTSNEMTQLGYTAYLSLDETLFQEAYEHGYENGLKDSDQTLNPESYDKGYNDGKNDFGYNDNGTIIPGQNAYDKGYLKGSKASGEFRANIIDFIPGVLGSIFMFFFQLGQIGILGITILDILGMIVLISGLIFLIKFFF